MVRLFACLILIIASAQPALSVEQMNSAASKAALQKLIQDYTGLYRKESLAQWKNLFHPAASIMFPADDGTINVRNIEEFYARQQNFFAQRKSVRERLENIHVVEGRRIARVIADYVFISEGVEKRGKLGLHLIEGKDGWKIAALVFSYNQP